MLRKRRRLAGLLGCCLGLLIPSWTSAQDVGPGGAARVVPGSPLDPLPGAAFNPFLNPYMTQQTYDPQLLGLYFLQAQRARGGIGSGRLSGMQSPAVTGRGREAANMPRSLSVPGGGAAGYFGRSPTTQRGQNPRANGHLRYFSNNGR